MSPVTLPNYVLGMSKSEQLSWQGGMVKVEEVGFSLWIMSPIEAVSHSGDEAYHWKIQRSKSSK